MSWYTQGMDDKEQWLSVGKVSRILGVTVRTLHRWEEAKKIFPIRLPSGQRRYRKSDVEAILRSFPVRTTRVAIYARVSSNKQIESGNLERQKERLNAVANERGYQVAHVITEQASGLNEKRRGLQKLLRLARNHELDLVLVEFRDRLARFGFRYIEEALSICDVRIAVVDGAVNT